MSLATKFMFEVKGIEEFVLNIPKEQMVHIYVNVYVEVDNFFIKIDDVDQEPPLKIYVYENNHRIIVDKYFYFAGLVSFRGKADSTYTIRFYNTGNKKLIEANQNNVLQTHQTEKLLEG